MTNDTNTRTKANAVFFAAIMVISMVAVGFAAAPAAAAADSVDATDVDFNDGDTTDIAVTSDGTSDDEANVVIDVNGNDQYDDGTDILLAPEDGSLDETGDNNVINFASVDVSSQSVGDYEVYAAAGDSTNGGAPAPSDGDTLGASNDFGEASTTLTVEDNVDITVTDVSPDPATSGEDVEFTVSASNSSGAVEGETITVNDADGLSFASTSVTTDSDGDAVFTAESVENQAGDYTVVFEHDGGDNDQASDTLTTEAEDVSNYDADRIFAYTLDSDADTAGDDASDAIENELVWQGQTVAVNDLEINTDVILREDQGDDGTRTVEELSTDDSGVVEIDTADLESGDYFLDGAGAGMEAGNSFEIASQSLSTDFDEDSVQSDEVADLEFNSNRGTYTLNVSADGDLDDGELEQLFADAGYTVTDVEADNDQVQIEKVNDGTVDANFSNVDDLDTGEYEFTFESVDTNAEDTASINVTEAADGDLQLNESSTSVAQGDIAEITVNLDETDEGTVVIGVADEDNYQANISVVDDDEDGEVVVQFNTFTAGNNSSDANIVSAEGDDEATLENKEDGIQNLTNQLDTGDYDISVSPVNTDGESDASAALDEESDIGSLIIEERSTDSMQLWRTTEDVAGDVVDVQDDDGDEEAVSAIAGGVEAGAVTQTDVVALGDSDDVLVHQITASGLEGALANVSDDNADALVELADAGAVDLTFTEQNPGANQDPDEYTLGSDSGEIGADDINVVYDEANDDYYVLANAGDIGGEDGDEYEVEFTVQDPRLTAADDDEDDSDTLEENYESVNSTFDFEDAEIEFDSDPVEVENAEEQNITGTTNVAPGSEVDVRVRSDEAQANFIKNAEDNVVTADGTFSSTFDFSEESVNDTFTVTTRNSPLASDEQAEADGTVVEAAEENPAAFEVSDLEPAEATATAGDSVTVSATIENTGDSNATQDVALTLDGEELDSQEVSLEAGGSTTVEFTADTSGLDAGDYTHGIATDDDEQTGTLTIEADDGDDGSDDGDDGSDDGDDGTDDGDDGTDDGDDGDDGTDDSTPGFGALVALVALIAAALLATRRTE
ncbi:BGTF surface domain-containing protein [Natronomonas sp.]|uniref:DUF7827 domain-containing protein n=1 Tax=Natronomonas sp. TaxID=2184060 RepID=UPI00397645FA